MWEEPELFEQIVISLRKRHINGYVVPDINKACEQVFSLIPKGASIGFGGSVTLDETGLIETLRNRNDVILFDRTKVKTSAELNKLYHQMYSCDVFLSSSNALTENGQLVNVDGIGNRVSMLSYGPKKVIIIVGKNKITKNLDTAFDRIKKIACPKNLKRIKELTTKSPIGSATAWTLENIWGVVSIIERQVDPNRMHVLIVNENLGY